MIKSNHVAGEIALQLGLLEEVGQHKIRILVFLQLDFDADILC